VLDGHDPDRPRLQLALVFEHGEKRSVNEQLLAEGLAFFRTRSDKPARQEALLAASQSARRKQLGVWAGTRNAHSTPPIQRGGVLGLYYEVEEADYHEQLDRVRKSRAEWVSLLIRTMVDKVDSSEVDIRSSKTVPDTRLRETIAYAKKIGLHVGLLPIVLIRNIESKDDWRGTLRPKDPGRFWRSYDAMLCHYLDIARETGVELVSIGSELCSLEPNADAWRRIIANARGRYPGWLTYSANWDHYDVPRFFELLDQVGMSAYFELSTDKDASLEVLKRGWRRTRADLERAAKRIGKPLILTELGYASQDGANTAPWNYYLATDKPDFREQADCFRAFAAVMGDATFLHGVYVYEFFEKGGMDDTTYAIWGKPAWDVVTKFLADFRR